MSEVLWAFHWPNIVAGCILVIRGIIARKSISANLTLDQFDSPVLREGVGLCNDFLLAVSSLESL